jgi:hypothetical protein
MKEKLHVIKELVQSKLAEFKFENSAGTKLLEHFLQQNIYDIIGMPDFIKTFRSLSTIDLHTHPLTIQKCGGKIKISTVDDESNNQGPSGKKIFDELNFDIATKTWDKRMGSVLSFIEITNIAGNGIFEPFGDKPGKSFSSVARKHIPNYDEARKIRDYGKRVEFIAKGKKVEKVEKKNKKLLSSKDDSNINALPRIF